MSEAKRKERSPSPFRSLVERFLDFICIRFGYFAIPLDTPERFERMAAHGYTLPEAAGDLKALRGFYRRKVS